MRDALDDQIEFYEARLPDIKEKYGAAWVLVAHLEVVQAFPKFEAAAQYAQEHLGGEQVLIRHTEEAALTAPFVDIAN
jgi:hypothetical protein